MQNYRGNANEYMRRGNNGRSSRNTCGNAPVSAPYSSMGNTAPCCECDDVLEGMLLAMAYVPWQNWRRIYEPARAFHRGTIFEELDLPFEGRGGCNQ